MTTVPPKAEPEAKRAEPDTEKAEPEIQKPEPEVAKKLTEEDVDEPIPHASREVYWHTEKKGVQLCSLVTMTVAPLVVYWRGARGMDVVMRAGRATAIGSVSSLAKGRSAYLLQCMRNRTVFRVVNFVQCSHTCTGRFSGIYMR